MGTPHNGLNGGGVPFFRLLVNEKVGILLVKKEYERLGKSVIGVCERT